LGQKCRTKEKMADPNSVEQPSSASTLRRPAGSILAPSRLSFGIGLGSSEKTNAFGSKISFSGLKASKLSSVTQAVCTSLNKPDTDENEKTEKTSSTPAATAQKPSFIPLAKEISNENEIKSSVAPAPSGLKNSGSNVLFGTCLNDRAANYIAPTASSVKNGAEFRDETTEGDADKSEIKSTEKSIEKEKTLSESAAEYCENRNKKIEFGEVELITGEEEETNAFQMSAKLYIFEKDNSSWLERGRGNLRLNDLRTQTDSETLVTSRIIMRTAGSLRVILNSKIFPEMTLEKPTEKNIRLTAMDGLEQGMKVFLVSGSPKEIGTLYSGLKRRLDIVKKSSATTSQLSPNKETTKRKMTDDKTDNTDAAKSEDGKGDEGIPPPEKEAKLVQ